jgi:hypothetical protein
VIIEALIGMAPREEIDKSKNEARECFEKPLDA